MEDLIHLRAKTGPEERGKDVEWGMIAAVRDDKYVEKEEEHRGRIIAEV